VVNELDGLELNFSKLYTKDYWSQLYKYPNIGIGVYYSNLGNDKYLGDFFSVFPFLKFGENSKSKIAFIKQIGFGIAYANKIYDKETNYHNLAISSSLNAFFKLKFAIKTKLYKNLDFELGLNLYHLSNGKLNKPNNGINAINLSFGLAYNYGKQEIVLENKFIKRKLKDKFEVVINNGTVRASSIDSHMYHVINFSTGYLFGLNARQRLGGGVDLFYDKSINRGEWDLDPDIGVKYQSLAACFIQHDLVIDKYSIITAIGTYFYKKSKLESPVYTKLGLKYNLSKYFLVQISLKAHKAKANFIGLGVGFQL
jgi:hypothetical protein